MDCGGMRRATLRRTTVFQKRFKLAAAPLQSHRQLMRKLCGVSAIPSGARSDEPGGWWALLNGLIRWDYGTCLRRNNRAKVG